MPVRTELYAAGDQRREGGSRCVGGVEGQGGLQEGGESRCWGEWGGCHAGGRGDGQSVAGRGARVAVRDTHYCPPPSVQELPSPIRFNPESAHSSPPSPPLLVQELPSPIRFNPESAHSSPTAMVAAGESRKPAYGLAGGGVDSLISVILFVLGRSSLACMWVISEAQFCAPIFVPPLLRPHLSPS